MSVLNLGPESIDPTMRKVPLVLKLLDSNIIPRRCLKDAPYFVQRVGELKAKGGENLCYQPRVEFTRDKPQT